MKGRGIIAFCYMISARPILCSIVTVVSVTDALSRVNHQPLIFIFLFYLLKFINETKTYTQ